MRVSKKAIMKIVIEGFFLEVDVEYPKKYRRRRKICCSHKNLKTSIKSWINTEKGAQSNSI